MNGTDGMSARGTIGGSAYIRSVVMAMGYDADSRRTSLSASRTIVPGGTTLDFINTYQFDDLDRVKWITQQGQTGGAAVAPKHVTFGYNQTGQLTAINRYESTGTTNFVGLSSLTYDLAGRIDTIWHLTVGGGGASYDYNFDRAGRLTQSVYSNFYVAGQNDTATFSYDDRSQLLGTTHTNTAVYGANPELYRYDGTGNRTQSHLHGTGYSAPASENNRLLSDGTYNYAYDAEGNLFTKTKIAGSVLAERYSWDHHNRLTKVEQFDEVTGAALTTVLYAYDPFDRRVMRSLDSGANGSIDDRDFFFYDDAQNVALVLDENGAVEHRYLFGPAVDMVLADESFNPSTGVLDDVYWALSDHQGSVRDIVDLDGGAVTLANHRNFDSYGRIVSETNPARDFAYAYTGREWDEVTDKQYNRARWYDASVGRWMSEDPIGFEAGYSNIYLYLNNAPIINRDPMGLDGPFGPINIIKPDVFPLPTGGTCKANQTVNTITGKSNFNIPELKKAVSNACDCIVIALDMLLAHQDKVRKYYQYAAPFQWLFNDKNNIQVYIDRLVILSNRCRNETIEINCGNWYRCHSDTPAYVDYGIFYRNVPWYRDKSVINICPGLFFESATDRSSVLIWELGRTVGFGDDAGSDTIDDVGRFTYIVNKLCKDSSLIMKR